MADLDYNASTKDTLALKYYYQHDPTLSPYSYSSVPGFTEHLDSGAQVASITNTLSVKSNLSTTQTLGILREKNWGDNEQPFGPGFHSRRRSRHRVHQHVRVELLSRRLDLQRSGRLSARPASLQAILNIGPNAEGQSPTPACSRTALRPRRMRSGSLGKHTVSFGASYTYTQLNTIDKRTGTGTIATDDFSQLVQGFVTPGSSATGFYVTSFLQGNASRYYRANQLGTYLQDKFQITPTLSLTAGVRYDWDGGLTEKYGRIFNFDSNAVQLQRRGSDTITESRLDHRRQQRQRHQGREQHHAHRPPVGHCVRALALHGSRDVPQQGGGPHRRRHVLRPRRTVQLLLARLRHRHRHRRPVRRQPAASFRQRLELPDSRSPVRSTFHLRRNGLHADLRRHRRLRGQPGESLRHQSAVPAPNNPKASDLSNYLPNCWRAIVNGGQPISLGVYDRANKLPYTMNYTLDIQWQPRNDLAIELGYVGNVGRHQVIPVPFNQPSIASPSSPRLAGSPYQQNYSYGYNVGGATLPGWHRVSGQL